ncbi:MAG TPA: glycosyltransferase [Gemmatimonadales bacterium]|jgi:glycosyltransferase involved in cell wall biosynthesis|nr:glycosyltransferase [Gemmatimonadales bacterium]
MRVLFLSTSMGMGGADSQLLSAARELRARGHDVLIVSLTPLGPMGLEARAAGIPTESLAMRRGLPDPRGLLRLARLTRSWRPDVVHSHMVHANLMARVLRLVAPVPALVSTIHNVYEGGRLRMAAYRLTNALVDHMTIVSQAAYDRFVTDRIVPARLLRVVPNGVDTARFRDLPPGTRDGVRRSLGLHGEFVWLAVGRFELAKDYPNMLRAFAAVRREVPTAVLLLVGRGSLQPETEALARELGLDGGAVRFAGVRSDVPEVMSAADGYVMSSAWEGMPMVLLEAAAAGLPIVSTRVGGNHEVVLDGQSGFLVPPSDHEALGAAMVRLHRLPDAERRAMGERGREHIRAHYDLTRVAERWEGLYREVLARKGLVLAPQLPR